MGETFDEMQIEAAAVAMYAVMTAPGCFTVSPATRAAIIRRLAAMFEAAADAPANQAHPLQVVSPPSPE